MWGQTPGRKTWTKDPKHSGAGDPPSVHQNHQLMRIPGSKFPCLAPLGLKCGQESEFGKKALQICLVSQLPPLRCLPFRRKIWVGGFQNLSRRKEAEEKAGDQHQLGDLGVVSETLPWVEGNKCHQGSLCMLPLPSACFASAP